MNSRKIANAMLGLALLFATGCYNRVGFEDEQGNSDCIVLPKGYSVEQPARIEQTDSNITITIIYYRREMK